MTPPPYPGGALMLPISGGGESTVCTPDSSDSEEEGSNPYTGPFDCDIIPPYNVQEIVRPDPLWPGWDNLEADIWDWRRSLFVRDPRHPMNISWDREHRAEHLFDLLTAEIERRAFYEEAIRKLEDFTGILIPALFPWAPWHETTGDMLFPWSHFYQGPARVWGQQALESLRIGESVRRIHWLFNMHSDMELGGWPHHWLWDNQDTIRILGGHTGFLTRAYDSCDSQAIMFAAQFHDQLGGIVFEHHQRRQDHLH